MVYCAGKPIAGLLNYYIKAIDNTFYGFIGLITHLGCSQTSRVGYYRYKPIESVVYCLITFFSIKWLTNACKICKLNQIVKSIAKSGASKDEVITGW